MKIIGIIIAGGRSSRMGTEKAFLSLAGKPLLSHVIDRLAPQVNAIVLNANGDPARFDGYRLPVVADCLKGLGTPLAGLHTALRYAAEHGFDAVVTVPSDAPFLPADLVDRLNLPNSGAAIAASGNQPHYLTGLWSCSLVEKLEDAIISGQLVRASDWAQSTAAHVITWSDNPFDPFFNVNTPAELAEVAKIAAEFNP